MMTYHCDMKGCARAQTNILTSMSQLYFCGVYSTKCPYLYIYAHVMFFQKSIRSTVLKGTVKNRIYVNIVGMIFSKCFNRPTVQRPLIPVPSPHLIAADSTYRKVLCKVLWLLYKLVC